MQSVAEGNAEFCIEFPEIDESHINITKAILANPEVRLMDSALNIYGLLTKKIYYTKVKM